MTEPFSSPDHDREASFVKLNERLDHLEQRLSALEQRPHVSRSAKKKEQPDVLRSTRRAAIWLGIFFLLFGNILTSFEFGWLIGLALIAYGIIVSNVVKPKYVEEPSAPVAEHAANTPAVSVPDRQKGMPVAAHSTFEVDIGRRVFAWVGITALLIGITFFVGYSFQHFGNIGKLLVGYGVAVLLFAVGRAIRKSLRAFSYVLEGGGWAALYFMTYATSFVPSVNIIDNGLVTLLLLFAVTALMAVVSLAERSPAFTAGAFLLGYGTAALAGNDGTLTLWAVLGLSVAVLALSLRLRWYMFCAVGSIATYLAFGFWLAPFLDKTLGRGDLLSGLLFLAAYGLIFGAGHLIAQPENSTEHEFIRAGVVFNVLFSFLGAIALFTVAGTDPWIVSLVYAGILFCFYGAARTLTYTRYLAVPYLVMAIVAFTAFLIMKFDDVNLTMLLVLEASALVVIGLFGRDRTLRILGYLVSVLGTFGALSHILASENATGMQEPIVIIVTLLAWLILAVLFSQFRNLLPQDERKIGLLYGDTAVILIAVYIAAHGSANLISPMSGALGLVVLSIGFVLRNKHVRTLAIAVLLYTVARVFLVDVVGLNAFGRMISFIVLGALLLLVAYLYNRSRIGHEEHKEPTS